MNKKKKKKLVLRPLSPEEEEKLKRLPYKIDNIDIKSVKNKEDKIGNQQEDIRTKELSSEKDKKIRDLEEEILILREKLKNEYPGWQIEADLAWRINPTTMEIEKYEIPIDFDIKNVRNLTIKEDMSRNFNYVIKSGIDNIEQLKPYKNIPNDLFYQLVGGKEKYRYPIYKNGSNNNIQTINDLKKILKNKEFTLKGKYGENVYKFIFENIGNAFTTGEFIKDCHFINRETARQNLQKLQEFEVIRKYGHGNYRVII
jgi:hypothetical protein